jgi:type II secretion system protein G
MDRGGFTLIELLIVIAIILILIAIALPNFLEAQVRAKVTKTKAELRTLDTAMAEYYLDWKIYPPESEHDIYSRSRSSAGHLWLTSPIKYITAVPLDTFNRDTTEGPGAVIAYESGGCEASTLTNPCGSCMVTWVIFSLGPDHQENEVSSQEPHYSVKENDYCVESYSPTNGTTSLGDIFVWGGDPFWIGVTMPSAIRKNYNGSKDKGLCVNSQMYLHRLPPGP